METIVHPRAVTLHYLALWHTLPSHLESQPWHAKMGGKNKFILVTDWHQPGLVKLGPSNVRSGNWGEGHCSYNVMPSPCQKTKTENQVALLFCKTSRLEFLSALSRSASYLFRWLSRRVCQAANARLQFLVLVFCKRRRLEPNRIVWLREGPDQRYRLVPTSVNILTTSQWESGCKDAWADTACELSTASGWGVVNQE